VADIVRRGATAETPFVADSSGDCLSASGESPWRTQTGDERIADDAAARRQVSITPKKIRASDGTVLVREWHGTKHQVTVLERRILISRQALSFRVANRTNDHRQSLVGSAVLRPEVTQQGAKQ